MIGNDRQWLAMMVLVGMRGGFALDLDASLRKLPPLDLHLRSSAVPLTVKMGQSFGIIAQVPEQNASVSVSFPAGLRWLSDGRCLTNGHLTSHVNMTSFRGTGWEKAHLNVGFRRVSFSLKWPPSVHR